MVTNAPVLAPASAFSLVFLLRVLITTNYWNFAKHIVFSFLWVANGFSKNLTAAKNSNSWKPFKCARVEDVVIYEKGQKPSIFIFGEEQRIRKEFILLSSLSRKLGKRSHGFSWVGREGAEQGDGPLPRSEVQKWRRDKRCYKHFHGRSEWTQR